MPESRFDLEKLVTVETFTSPWEAQLARARLESEGIHSVIADENFIRLYWALSNAVGGVKLQVREDDVTRATELLQSRQPIPEIYLVTDEEAARPRCPGCKSDRVFFQRWSRRGFVGSWILFGLPLPIPSRRWICHNCGAEWREEEIGSPQPEPLVEEPALLPRTGVLVTVARFITPWEAHLARTLLESHGLEAVVFEERLPPIDLLTGRPLALNRLEVHEEDADRALEILDELEGVEDPEELPASD
jgi:Putative prokaryotic signal transducing protein